MPAKTCKKCGTTKPIEDFSASYYAKDGRDGTCRSCRRAAADSNREYRRSLIAPRARKPRGQVIYFVQAERIGYFKIGIAKDTTSRLAELQTGCPTKLTLRGIATVAEGLVAHQVEQFLHSMMAPFQEEGEWFSGDAGNFAAYLATKFSFAEWHSALARFDIYRFPFAAIDLLNGTTYRDYQGIWYADVKTVVRDPNATSAPFSTPSLPA